MSGEIVTVRIPELAQQVVDLSLGDKIPVWIAETNKTKHVNISALRSFVISGGGATVTPVQSGGVVLYKVPAYPDGTDTVSIPSIAGKSFNLEINGIPFIPQQDPAIADAEFELLAGGGFKLLNDLKVFGGEKCKLEIFGSVLPPVGTPGTGSAIIEGVVNVNTNKTIDVSTELRKLIQIRALSTQITLTLPSVDDIPDHTIIPIEAAINNTKQNKITGTGGQYFYFNNTSRTSFYINPGEVVWLYRGEDGFYVINDFGNNYKTIGDPYASYSIKPNTLLCQGQLVNRADYPRLWEYVQGLGASLVDDTTWATAEVTVAGRAVQFPYRGCFSTGDGSTTFRLPNLMNMFLRGIKSTSGSDTERHLNKPGGYSKDEVILHGHEVDPPDSNDQNGFGKTTTGNSGPESTGVAPYNTSSYGGLETRPENIAVYWLINY